MNTQGSAAVHEQSIPSVIPAQRSATPGSSSGDRASALWQEHYGRLAGWCAAMLRDRERGHDVASEAFVRLLARWDRVRDPRGYLYITAINLMHDQARGDCRNQRLVLRLVESTPLTTDPVDAGLRDLVERLPEHLRRTVLLYYYADMSIAEVASALRRPAGTVKRRLADARAILRRWVEASAGDR